MTEDTTELTPQQKAAITRAKKKAEKEDQEVEITFGVCRRKDGWYYIKKDISGDNIVSKDEVGPLMRAIAVEEFKINVQRHLDSME